MGKATAPKKAKAAKRVAVPHPIIVLAISNGARLERGQFEVGHVHNPFGEVSVRGEVLRHKAVRRVPRYETLHRTKGIDDTVFACLEWYADRFAVSASGMFRCGLASAGSGGGSVQSHIPTCEATMMARSDVRWARGFIPTDLLPLFDMVMQDDEPFERVGPALYPSLSLDRAKRRASTAFKLAANHLMLGVGHRVLAVA